MNPNEQIDVGFERIKQIVEEKVEVKDVEEDIVDKRSFKENYSS